MVCGGFSKGQIRSADSYYTVGRNAIQVEKQIDMRSGILAPA